MFLMLGVITLTIKQMEMLLLVFIKYQAESPFCRGVLSILILIWGANNILAKDINALATRHEHPFHCTALSEL